MDFSLNTIFWLPRHSHRPQTREQRRRRRRTPAGVLRSTSAPAAGSRRRAGAWAPAGRGEAPCAQQQPIGAEQVAGQGRGEGPGRGKGSLGRGKGAAALRASSSGWLTRRLRIRGHVVLGPFCRLQGGGRSLTPSREFLLADFKCSICETTCGAELKTQRAGALRLWVLRHWPPAAQGRASAPEGVSGTGGL